MMIMIVRPILMLLVFAQQVMLFFCFAFDFITPSSITKILHYYCCCCCLKQTGTLLSGFHSAVCEVTHSFISLHSCGRPAYQNSDQINSDRFHFLQRTTLHFYMFTQQIVVCGFINV